jgi:hypothetical protein
MLAIIAHDAGGAEILSSYVRREHPECIYVLQGPALRIFERKLGSVDARAMEEAVTQATSILCGTSWQSDLELRATKMARALGKRTVAFLDHWVCYRERFVRSGEVSLPDEIWVGDLTAEAMAAETFPGVPISLVDNPYLLDIRQELAGVEARPSSTSDGRSVLYICEPLREQALLQYGDERYWGYVEEEALRFFLANVAVLGDGIKQIVIRPHPAEAPQKYDWAQHEFDLPVTIGGSRTLIREISDSHVVVGCESMAMVVALLAGKRVISCIPPGGKPSSLPHREIESLQSLLATRAAG